MRLSEAILLGDSLKRGTNMEWLSPDGSCGCAFGGALLAAGADPAVFNAEILDILTGSDGKRRRTFAFEYVREAQTVRQLWPWLTNEHLVEITRLYQQALKGKGTIEQVVSYVRSVEPAEAEPVLIDAETQVAREEAVGSSVGMEVLRKYDYLLDKFLKR